MNWTDSQQRELEADRHGWPKNRGQVWDTTIKQRIESIQRDLERDPHEFYSGASANQRCYRNQYPEGPVLPLRTIGRFLKELDLSNSPKQRVKGVSRYLCYSEYTVYETLGKLVLEADFIGKKYLAGRSEPLNFIGFSLKKAPRIRYF